MASSCGVSVSSSVLNCHWIVLTLHKDLPAVHFLLWSAARRNCVLRRLGLLFLRCWLLRFVFLPAHCLRHMRAQDCKLGQETFSCAATSEDPQLRNYSKSAGKSRQRIVRSRQVR